MPYGATFATNTKLNDWMLELCYMLVSLNVCGVSVLPSELKSDILFSPLLERGLTSHLQTFGCSVIMSTSVQEINQAGIISCQQGLYSVAPSDLSFTL